MKVELLIFGNAFLLAVAACSAKPARPPHEAKPVTAWVEDLKSPEAEVRRQAYGMLAAYGPAAAEPLVAALGQPEYPKVYVARALATLGPLAQPAVEPLTKLLADPDERVRGNAVMALGCIGPAAGASLPALLAAVGDPSPNVRTPAAIYLPCLTARPEDATKVLAAVGQLAQDSDRNVRREALSSLAHMGPGAIPHLLAVLADPSEAAQRLASQALEEVSRTLAGAQPYVPEIARKLTDPSEAVRYAAIVVLGQIGPDAAAALPELKHLQATAAGLAKGALEKTIAAIEKAPPPKVP